MTSIFVSHSKHDKDIVNYFAKAFGRVGLAIKLMELEDLDNKYAGYVISNTIRYESNGIAFYYERVYSIHHLVNTLTIGSILK